MSENEQRKDRSADLSRLQQNLTKEIEEEIARKLSAETDLSVELKESVKEKVKERVKELITKELEEEIQKVREEERKRKIQLEVKPEIVYYPRFNLNIRIQHIFLIISTIILIFSGIPIKFHDSAWASFYFNNLLNLEGNRILHRIGAGIMIAVALYHLFYIAFIEDGRENFKEVMPRIKDFKDLWMMLNYFLGRSMEKPEFAKYSYIDKFDYWAVYWGMAVMVLSGLMLWFLVPTLYFLPKFIVDAAKEAHSDEAMLATLAIVIWHFYNAHLNPEKFPMNRVWLTGKQSEEEMIKEHPLELEKLKIKKRKTDVGANL